MLLSAPTAVALVTASARCSRVSSCKWVSHRIGLRTPRFVFVGGKGWRSGAQDGAVVPKAPGSALYGIVTWQVRFVGRAVTGRGSHNVDTMHGLNASAGTRLVIIDQKSLELPGAHHPTATVLGGTGLRHYAALRYGSGRWHITHSNIFTRTWARALECCLRATQSTPDGWALW